MGPLDVSRYSDAIRRAFLGPGGASLRVVVALTLAGGVFTGGIFLGALALLDRVSPGLHLLVAPALFVAGTAMGLLHSLVLAVIGRPTDTTRFAALRQALVAAVCSLPLVGAAWLVSSAITLGSALRTDFRWSWLLVSGAGWLIGVGLCFWAACETACIVRTTRERWTARR